MVAHVKTLLIILRMTMKKHIDCYGRDCHACGTYKKWDQYAPAKHTNTGHIGTCRDCVNERAKKYHKKNKINRTIMEGFCIRRQEFYLGKTAATT